jgi:hypothetical protein
MLLGWDCCLTRHGGLGGARKCAMVVVVEGKLRSFWDWSPEIEIG